MDRRRAETVALGPVQGTKARLGSTLYPLWGECVCVWMDGGYGRLCLAPEATVVEWLICVRTMRFESTPPRPRLVVSTVSRMGYGYPR